MILTYHELGHEESPDLYKVSVAHFEQHLCVLKNLSNAPSRACDWVVTFDDGHISHYELASPVLAKHGIQSIFFITSEWIGSTNRMSQQQIRDLLAAGHQIGSHTCSHAFLPGCSDRQLQYELHDSRKKLEDILGSNVNAISVPYGRWDRRVLRTCRESGYTRVYTSDPWLPPAVREGIMSSGRLTIRNSFGANIVRDLLTAKGLTKVRLQAPFMAKQMLKACIGDRLYHRIWHIVANRDASLLPAVNRQQ